MKQICKNIAIVALIIFSVVVIAIGSIIYTRTLGVAAKDAQREAFKATSTYNEGMLDDLAKYQYEFNTAEADVERSAIAQLVVSRFANFDESRIENDDLKQFLEDCRNGDF